MKRFDEVGERLVGICLMGRVRQLVLNFIHESRNVFGSRAFPISQSSVFHTCPSEETGKLHLPKENKND